MRFQDLLFAPAVAFLCSLASGSIATAQEVPAWNEPAIPAPIIEAGRLNLRVGDVVTAQRPNLLDDARAAFDPQRRYVLQLEGPITPEVRAQIQQAGIVLGDYLPSYAYIVNLSGVDVANLQGMNFLRWVGEYESAWKIDPEIGRHEFVTPMRREVRDAGRVIVEISLFDGFEVDPALDEITAIPGAVVYQNEIDRLGSNWVIPVEMPAENVPLLAEIDAVQFVEEAAEFIERRNNSVRSLVQTGTTSNDIFWTNGLRGEGQIVGILDSRIDPNHCSFVDNQNPIGPNHRKIHAYNSSIGAEFHGTHVAGTAVGDAGTNSGSTRGVAYMARLVFNTMPFLSQSSVQNRHQTHHNQGARVHSNSWGATAHITSYHGATRAIDLFMRSNEESLVVHSVANNSNDGPTISIPENAKNLIAVGASWKGGGTGSTSINAHCTAKPGPTADGRRKPEVFAPGCNTFSANNNTSCGTASSSGTSMATPAVAGLALLVRQYFTAGYYPTGSANPSNAFTPSAALVKAVILNSAQRMTHASAGSGYPNNVQGWGRVLGNATVFFPGQSRTMIAEEIRNNSGLSTGQIMDIPFEVTSSSETLRVTLAFTDVAGSSGSSNPVVNDLDLEVISPGGTLYRGNVFSNNFSVPGGSKDALNNVEQVHIANPQTGEWTARVRAAAVNSGFQGFGVVISGAVIGGDVEPPPPPPPLNDTCPNATAAVGTGSFPFSNVNASTAGFDEPNLCNFNGYTHIDNDVWFLHQATCTGDVTISLCGADYNTKLAVYLGSSCPTGPNQASACNDNHCATSSQVTVSATQGQFMRIRIGGFQGAMGSGTMVISCGAPPPENNTCDDALIVKDDQTPFSTENATTDGPSEAGACNFGGSSAIEQDVWFIVQAECTGQMHLSVCDADFSARLAVYDEMCPNGTGQAIACDFGSCVPGSELTFDVVQDEHYIVRVGSSAGQTGSGTLGVSCTPEPQAPACPADLTGTGTVNVFDLLELLAQWGPCDNCADCPADLTETCTVNVFDLLELLAQWGPCPE